MWASVSAQGSALSETWGQNLDLTIQSSEMPLTWALDSKDKHEIMLGWTCCYRNELINSVQTEHSQKLIKLKLKENQKRFEYTHHWELIEPPTPFDWTIFVALQLADVYTTSRGLKYDCVKELNPLIGERPSVDEMIFVKVATLAPAIQIDYNRGLLTQKSIRSVSSFMGIVVANNYNVLRRAEKYCSKR